MHIGRDVIHIDEEFILKNFYFIFSIKDNLARFISSIPGNEIICRNCVIFWKSPDEIVLFIIDIELKVNRFKNPVTELYRVFYAITVRGEDFESLIEVGNACLEA